MKTQKNIDTFFLFLFLFFFAIITASGMLILANETGFWWMYGLFGYIYGIFNIAEVICFFADRAKALFLL